jgi:hypothetical protein
MVLNPGSTSVRLAQMTPDERAADAIALVARVKARLAQIQAIEYEDDPANAANVTDAGEE